MRRVTISGSDIRAPSRATPGRTASSSACRARSFTSIGASPSAAGISPPRSNWTHPCSGSLTSTTTSDLIRATELAATLHRLSSGVPLKTPDNGGLMCQHHSETGHTRAHTEETMIKLNSPELRTLATELKKYEFRTTVAHLAGLLTVPSLNANTIRLETMVHLAVANCQGHRKPRLRKIYQWLNEGFRDTAIPMQEDPAEDVFVTNVRTPQGNCRVFQSIWPASDYCVQIIIDVLHSGQVPEEFRKLLESGYALLELSDLVAERSGLPRWYEETTTPQGEIRHIPDAQVRAQGRAITFTQHELIKAGIRLDFLRPFILSAKSKHEIAGETIGDTSLERYPLVQAGNKLLLTLPHAVGPAIRRFVLTKLRGLKLLSWFSDAVAGVQAKQIQENGIFGFHRRDLGLPTAITRGCPVPLKDWLLEFDVNRYLHLVLLADQLDRPDVADLSSQRSFSRGSSEALFGYLDKVANYCNSLSDHAEGISLVVIGGIGHSYSLFRRSVIEKQWGLSCIAIADFLTLLDEHGDPIARFLKCIRQKAWMEERGVEVFNFDGDYTVYCYWQRSQFSLVPATFSVSPESFLSIGSDCALPVRKEVRSLSDRHSIETINGDWVTARRLKADSFFESEKIRPIYASLPHVRAGVLAGVISTGRGPSWLLVRTPIRGEHREIIYNFWDGFLLLFEKLVFEIERSYPHAPKGPVEIQLDFSQVELSEERWDPEVTAHDEEPVMRMSRTDRKVEIGFPGGLLGLFQDSGNTGERMVVRSLAKAIVGLHEENHDHHDDSMFEEITARVVGGPGTRVFHVFPAFDSVEQLQAKHSLPPVFVSPEDFAFAKLQLVENSEERPDDLLIIESKTACNRFLHKTVDRIAMQLRDLLGQFDRGWIIREGLRVHESIILDREHWSRTARAIHSLYGGEEDVHSVARTRERQRIQAGLASRTLLEMAICECPALGGRPASSWEIEQLLAKTILMIEVATHSEAVKNDLAPAKIELLANGAYDIEIGFNRTVMEPFTADQFRDQYERDIENYDELYGPKPLADAEPDGGEFPTEFLEAYEIEFGLSVKDMIAGVAELIDLAVEEDTLIVETKVGEFRSRLRKKRGLTEETSEVFIRTLGLFHRNRSVPPQ